MAKKVKKAMYNKQILTLDCSVNRKPKWRQLHIRAVKTDYGSPV